MPQKAEVSDYCLFALMHRMELVEDLGSGIRRIRRAVKSYGQEAPLIEVGETWFSLTFKRKQEQKAIERDEAINRVGEKVGDRITDNQRTILQLVRENPVISAAAAAKHIGISLRKTEENIRKLREKGILVHVGSARSGHWIVRE